MYYFNTSTIGSTPTSTGVCWSARRMPDSALSTTGFAGEREEIGTSSLAVNRVPRGAAGSSSGQGLSDPRKSGWDPHDDRADPGG